MNSIIPCTGDLRKIPVPANIFLNHPQECGHYSTLSVRQQIRNENNKHQLQVDKFHSVIQFRLEFLLLVGVDQSCDITLRQNNDRLWRITTMKIGGSVSEGEHSQFFNGVSCPSFLRSLYTPALLLCIASSL